MTIHKSVFALLLAGLLLASAACQKEKPSAAEASKPAPEKAEAKAPEKTEDKKDPNVIQLAPESAQYAQLKFAEVSENLLTAPLEVTGHIAVNEDRTTRVGSLFSGRITEVKANVGDFVKQGQALARMHTHEVHEAQAEYVKAQAELEQRKTTAAHAKSLLARAERLYQAKALALNELEKARLEDQVAQREITRAEAEVQRAIGHREHLGLPDNLNYDEEVTVRAPSSGVVMKREISAGASVNPGENLFFISDLSTVWIMAEAPEKNLAALRVGQPVTINVAAYPDATFAARIARIGETLNADTRTIDVRCLAVNRGGKLKPEMYARVGLSALGTERSALLVPHNALQEIEGKQVVFIARENRQFEKRVVTVGQKQGELIEIINGLARGDRVVTTGSFQLKSEFMKEQLADE